VDDPRRQYDLRFCHKSNLEPCPVPGVKSAPFSEVEDSERNVTTVWAYSAGSKVKADAQEEFAMRCLKWFIERVRPQSGTDWHNPA